MQPSANANRASRSAAVQRNSAGTDIVALGIAFAAIIMFVGTGSSVLVPIVKSLNGHGFGPDKLLSNALLLNIALIIFGWRRYRELSGEVAERRKAEEQARFLAEADPLTGCLNRRSVTASADQLIAEASQRGEAVAFIMIDLDQFKQINDSWGHSAGDRMLTESARRLSAALPTNALIARVGGDEFACIVPFDPARPGQIDQLLNSLTKSISQPVSHADATLETTISAGIYRRNPGSNESTQAALHQADIAMYQAKKRGRNRYCWFDPAMESELKFRTELESGIRRGLAAGEFMPFYQKQIDLETGELVGFEMLARWRSEKLGMVSPEIFIPVAEDIGLIALISESLIRQALNDARYWDPKLTLSVNISPLQLRDPWFAQKLLKLMVEANFAPNRLDIEVTESCLHENLGLVRSLITSLQNQGVTVSLDDFGTGYSSLAQLRSLPFDRIKIDRSFVATVLESPESATIIQSIIALGEGLGLPVTAEGIESHEVLARLRELGNIKGQGFLYGLPEAAAGTTAKRVRHDRLLEPPVLIEADLPENVVALRRAQA